MLLSSSNANSLVRQPLPHLSRPLAMTRVRPSRKHPYNACSPAGARGETSCLVAFKIRNARNDNIDNCSSAV